MKNNVLVKIDRDPLFGMSRNDYVNRLKNVLSGRVEEAYIFGSFTRDDFGRFSDIDLILVCDTPVPFVECASSFHDLLDLVLTTDILVYTPAEFEHIMENANTGFWKSVKAGMVRII